MSKREATPVSRLITCAWIAGVLLIVVMVVSYVTASMREKPLGLAAGPFEFSVDEDAVSFIVVFEGDGAWFRKHLTEMAWHNEFQIRLTDRNNGGPGLEVRATHGTTVNGRQVRLISPTWWLIVFLFLPAWWRWAASVRSSQGTAGRLLHGLRVRPARRKRPLPRVRRGSSIGIGQREVG